MTTEGYQQEEDKHEKRLGRLTLSINVFIFSDILKFRVTYE